MTYPSVSGAVLDLLVHSCSTRLLAQAPAGSASTHLTPPPACCLPQKQKHEAEVRRSKHQSEKERILLAIEDDKRMRAMVQQMVGPVTSPRGSAGGQEGSGRSSTSPREGGTGGDAAAGPGAAAAARASGAGAAADAS